MYPAYLSSVVFISFNIQNSNVYQKTFYQKTLHINFVDTNRDFQNKRKISLSPFRGLPMHLTGYRYIRLSISAGKPVL